VESEVHVVRVVTAGLRPIRLVVSQQDRVPAGSCCTVGDDALDSPDILDEIVPAEVLCTLAPQCVLLGSIERSKRPGFVLEFDGDNVAVLFDPDVDVKPLVQMRDLDGALEPHRGARQAFVYLPGDGVLEVGLRMEDGALIGKRG
jgi:hypothetical protein